jgi:hypothetical protein
MTVRRHCEKAQEAQNIMQSTTSAFRTESLGQSSSQSCKADAVIVSQYTAGQLKNPTLQQVQREQLFVMQRVVVSYD